MATFKQYELKNGTKKWMFNTYLGINPVTGKPIKTTRRNFISRKEAQRELNRLLVEFEDQGLVKQEKIKYEEVYNMWFETYQTTVKEATSMSTERHMNKHILPILGDLYIDRIDVRTAQKLTISLSNKIQSYKTVIQYASKVMQYATNLELIDNNPFDKIVRPKAKRMRKEKEVKFYTAEEINQVLTYLDNKITRYTDKPIMSRYFVELDYTMYRLLAFSGMRGGEALALTFDDIDYSTNTININKNLSQVKGGYVVSTTKTKSSNRVITLDDKTMHILKRWQLKQKELLFEYSGKTSNIVFPDIYGNHSNRQLLYQRSTRLAKEVGLPNIGSHGWRHSHASLLYSAGATMKEAQERLGHSSMEITSTIYTHLSEKQKTETADKIAKYANF